MCYNSRAIHADHDKSRNHLVVTFEDGNRATVDVSKGLEDMGIVEHHSATHEYFPQDRRSARYSRSFDEIVVWCPWGGGKISFADFPHLAALRA